MPIPFRMWMETALGVLNWTPATFWSASYIEFSAALEGWMRLQRGKVGQPEPMTREEADEMFAAEERRVARLSQNAAK